MTTELTLKEFLNLPLEVAALRKEVAALRREIAARAPSPPLAPTTRPASGKEDHLRFVSIDYFMIEMLGYKARSSYYNHRNDKGWPQRVYPTGKPMLIYEECVAYQTTLSERREPPPPIERLQVKRHPGRPAKPHPRA